jgi:putative hydrolase of the HAD superfamily
VTQGDRAAAYRAVLFDLGGVVFPSPFDAFTRYERAHGLPDRFIRGVVAASADHGAWARLERNEVTFDEFCTEFAAECLEAGGRVDAAVLMRDIGRGLEPIPIMLAAIEAIHSQGLKVGALTNNWAATGTEGDRDPHSLGHLGRFDVVVESAVEGLRKPDPRIYELACDRLGVTPPETVFLDDLGVNLKPARELGMATIKVEDPVDALCELSQVLGFAVLQAG